MKHIIHCPKCNKKIDERDNLQEGELIKKRCETCKLTFWVLPEMKLTYLVDYKKIGG